VSDKGSVSAEVTVEAVPASRLLDELRKPVVDVWARAHDLPRSSPTRRDFAGARLPAHAGRAGFRFRGAFDGHDALVGFVYGYTGSPGQWWHDRVAAALHPADRRRWLEPEHFELTELAVGPEFQGRGIGSRLHDEVLDGLSHRRAVLSALADNEPVIGFYRRRGWQIVLEQLRFEAGRPAFTIMGLELEPR
jgi:ribosomal protein S18 acetylase RimI-like enzyme